MLVLENSKLLTLLKSLTSDEFKELGLWVTSPIHNSSTKVKQLYQAFGNRFKKNKKPELIYLLRATGILSSGKSKKDISPKEVQEFRIVASKLTIQIEEFLIWKNNNLDQINRKRSLMDQLISRQLFDLMPSVLNKTEKILAHDPYRDIQHCKHQYQLDEMKFYLDLFQKNRSATASLQKTLKSLEHYCLAQLLRYYTAVTNSRNLISEIEDFAFMESIKQHLSSIGKINHFTVEIYFKLLILIDEKQPNTFYELKELVFNSFECFDKNELRQFFGFMTNFCSTMIEEGNDEFSREKFELYKVGLQLDTWAASIYFSKHQFTNIVYIGLENGEPEWVKSFIDEYHGKLNPKLKDETINLCFAFLKFKSKNYSKALQYLNQIKKPEDFLNHCQIEILIIKIYFESEPMDFDSFSLHPVHARLKAFSAYLKIASGRKMSEKKKQLYSNFIFVMKKILQLKKKQLMISPRNKKAVLKLKESIENLQQNCTELSPIRERTWLLKQIQNLS